MWTKRDSSATLEEVITRNLGYDASMIDVYSRTEITNLDIVAAELKKIAAEKKTLTVFADYDADGICSAVILRIIMHELGINAQFMFPKRTTGYGLQPFNVDVIDTDYILTVDNGIAANEAIQKAKDKGIKVIVLDHHLAQEELPPADIIVDPHVYKNNEDDFEDWCGAGLAFELSRFICEKASQAVCLQFAAIATVADVVPLRKDNRWIVKKGLGLINKTNVLSLSNMLRAIDVNYVDEQAIGFKIGPIINAMGRVKDAAEKVFNYFISGDPELLQELVETNEIRKKLVQDGIDRAYNIIAEECLLGNIPIVIYDPKTIEGIVGVVAGRIAEEMQTPVICLTDAAEPGVIKGSARSPSINIKEALDEQKDILLHYGGHAGAAGLSLKKDDLDELCGRFAEQFMEYIQEEAEDNIYYDLEISASEINSTVEALKQYAPFGEGNPQPVFKINDYKLYPRAGAYYKLMGSDNATLKLFGDKSCAIGFGMAEKYNATGLAKQLALIGKLSENHYRGVEAQVEIYDLVAEEKTKTVSELSSKLADMLKIEL